MIHQRQVGHIGGVVQLHHFAVPQVDVIDHRRGRGDQFDVIFPLKAVADHFQMQKAQKAAAKAKTQCGAGFHFGGKTGVVQRKLGNRLAQVLKLGVVHRKQATKHHGLGRRKPRQGLSRAAFFVRNGVAHLGVAHPFYAGRQKADLARAKAAHMIHLGPKHANPVDAIGGTGVHHADAVAFFQHPVDDADQNDNAKIGVVPAVNQHGFQGRVCIARGRRQFGHNRFQHVRNAKARFGRDFHGPACVQSDHILDLLGHPRRFCRGQVDLVQHRHDLVVRIQRLIDIGQRLRLHPLRGIHHQQRALNRPHGAADLIGEIHMAGGVNQVENIVLTVLRRILNPNGVGLDGDPPLPLDIHRVQKLRLHIPLGHRAGRLDQAVGKRGFAVVDMGHDGEIADMGEVCHGCGIWGSDWVWSMGWYTSISIYCPKPRTAPGLEGSEAPSVRRSGAVRAKRPGRDFGRAGAFPRRMRDLWE